jgi:hypothetical protein
MTSDEGFFSRWSRRKALPPERRQLDERGQAEERALDARPSAPPVVVPAPEVPAPASAPVEAEAPKSPPPTMDDVAALTRDADYSRFVAPDVDAGVKQAALRKLFSEPHFNVMDGLDTYIDDYNKADPLPASMVRKMAQSAFLGLFREDDENADLQLQPDDAHRRPGADEGAAGEPERHDDEPA